MSTFSARLLLPLLLSPALAQAQTPRWVRLSYSEPDASTNITVTWNADPPLVQPSVRWGTSPSYGQETTGVFSSDPLPGALGYVYTVTLTGLSPDTLYHYSAGAAGAWSPDATFMTAAVDGCAPLSFVVLGDCRSDDNTGASAKWHDILQEAWEHDPLFALNTGDLVRDGTEPNQWQDFMEKTEFASAFLPQLPTIGNHDNDSVEGDGALYNRLFSLPRNPTSGTEDYYAFTAGNAVLAVLSSQTYKDDAFAAQAAWLDATLTAHADKLWKFVFLHHPIYTSHAFYDLGFTELEFNHPPNEQGQNAALVPVLDAHHVDLVFSGHNHYYERFLPLKGGGGALQGSLANGYADGTAYVITGGGGAFTYDDFDLFGVQINLIDWVCGSNAAVGSAHCDGRHHYVVVDIANDALTMSVYSTTQQNFGTETPELFDSITITKTGGEVCTTPPDDGGPTDGGRPDGGPSSDAETTGGDGDGDTGHAGQPRGCHCAGADLLGLLSANVGLGLLVRRRRRR